MRDFLAFGVDQGDEGFHIAKVEPVFAPGISECPLGVFPDIDAEFLSVPALMVGPGHGIGDDALPLRVVFGKILALRFHSVGMEIVLVEIRLAVNPVSRIENPVYALFRKDSVNVLKYVKALVFAAEVVIGNCTKNVCVVLAAFVFEFRPER